MDDVAKAVPTIQAIPDVQDRSYCYDDDDTDCERHWTTFAGRSRGRGIVRPFLILVDRSVAMLDRSLGVQTTLIINSYGLLSVMQGVASRPCNAGQHLL